MRDLILLATFMIVAPLMLRAPIVGLLAWLWIALMNPQREVYGFLSGAQLNLVAAAVTIFVWAASRERKTAQPNPLVFALVLFGIWCCVTTFTALDRPSAAAICDRTVKSIILALAVATLANTRSRIQAVLWMVAVSLGYYAVKGGGFVLLTGGNGRVYGPANSMIGDNNTLGLALVVLLPVLGYLRGTTRSVLTRLATLVVTGFTLLAIIGTYSRGALVALAAAGVMYAFRSRTGIVMVIAGAILVAAAPSFMPHSWLDRMSTLQTYQSDESFQGRVSAWRTSFNIAADRPLVGGGFAAVEQAPIVARYQSRGSLTNGRAAHSIYFEVLGDHGFVGLGLYLLVLLAAWANTLVVVNTTRRRPDLVWAGRLARMLQVCLVAFMVGGAALSMAYYDGVLVILSLTAGLAEVARRPLEAAEDPALAPGWRRSPVRASAAASAAAI